MALNISINSGAMVGNGALGAEDEAVLYVGAVVDLIAGAGVFSGIEAWIGTAPGARVGAEAGARAEAWTGA